MKILMLTPYLPFPPSSGGQVRSYNLVKNLGKKHDITLFSLIKDDSERKYIRELEKFCKEVKVFKRSKSPWTLRNILLTGFGPYPFLVIRNIAPAERRAVKEELGSKKYDLIHAETFYVMPHIPATSVPILLVEQTIEYRVYQHYVDSFPILPLRPLLYIDVFKLKFWERYFWRRASKVVAVSEADREDMLKLEPELEVDLVPNGVDLDFFIPKESRAKDNKRILFVSNFKWLQNIEAAELLVNEIFPVVKKQVPAVRLWIVGQHIPEKIKKLATDDIVVESLPEEEIDAIRKVYNQTSVFVAPMKGPGGTRLKNLAAMASKLPIVTTSIGAQGIGVRDRKEALIRDGSQQMADGVVELLNNPKKARALAENARRLAEKKFSWEQMAKKLDKVYKEAATSK